VRDLRKSFKTLNRKPGFKGAISNLFSRDYKEIKAVDGVSFDIGPGEMVGYIGPNGAGKSTTIKMLTGILHPSSGSLQVDGSVPQKDRVRNSKKIGVIFGQRSQLLWDLPPSDSFELMRRMYAVPMARFKENLREFTELLELGEFMERPVRQLSLGQRMRCELVAALLHDPSIVYLDEPTIGMDVVAKERIRDFILKLNAERGTTIILTTHDIMDIERLCQRVIIIDKGRVIYDGSLAELKRKFGRERRVVCSLDEGGSARGAAESLEESLEKSLEESLEKSLEESLEKSLEESLEKSLQKSLAECGPGIRVKRRDDGNLVISFDPQAVTAASLTRRLVNNFAVKDLAVEEVDLEGIIRVIYEEGSA
jgi:ABC-2 type transport system ATP-binding protein